MQLKGSKSDSKDHGDVRICSLLQMCNRIVNNTQLTIISKVSHPKVIEPSV